jgi:polyhydroxyalkanoate synthesis regulator phasin
MKHLITYNESIKDKMTPRSEADIKAMFSKLTPIDKIERGAENGVMWAVEEGLRELGKIKKSLRGAIYNAVQNHHLDIAEYLVNNGNMNLEEIDEIKDIFSYMMASQKEFKDRVIGKLNAKRLSILKEKKDYVKQLQFACEHNDYDLAVEAIKLGADVKDKYGMYMWKAIGTGNEKLVKLLLESGVPAEQGSNPTAVGANQNVEKATSTNNVTIVKLLLQYGSKIVTGKYCMLNTKIKEWVEKGLNHEMLVFLLTEYPEFGDILNGEIAKLDAKMKLYQKYVK